jgi:hypothetical protein
MNLTDRISGLLVQEGPVIVQQGPMDGLFLNNNRELAYFFFDKISTFLFKGGRDIRIVGIWLTGPNARKGL